MPIYNHNGTSISECYGIQGGSLSEAYNVDGTTVFTKQFTVMTYNVQHFTGINGQQTMQQSIIDTYNADIIGMQEVTKNGTMPTVGVNVLTNYPNKRMSNHINYMCMVSKIPLSNVVISDFVNQDPEDMSRWNETRAYMMADIVVGGKTIKWVNTHLCFLTPEIKYLQMAEVFNLVKNEEYVIVTGDFNTSNYTSPSDAEYANMFAQFANAGFVMANHQPTSYTKTWTNSTNATSLDEFITPTDDIIVSSNIGIVDVVFDTTKLNYLNGQPIDHIPIIARLTIN